MPYGLPDNQWDVARREMREALLRRARERRTITYGELSREIGAARLEPRHRRFGVLLTEVCEVEEAAGRPTLGSLVVKGDTGMPGAGYFCDMPGLARDARAERTYWESELERVFAWWAGSDDTDDTPAPGSTDARAGEGL